MRAVAEGRLENTSRRFATHIDRVLVAARANRFVPRVLSTGNCLSRVVKCVAGAAEVRLCLTDCCGLRCGTCGCRQRGCGCFLGCATVSRSAACPVVVENTLARLFSPRAEFALALLESSRPVFRDRNRNRPANRTKIALRNVLLFTGCVGEGLFARVNRATERVLRANNFKVSTPPEQVCCGALHAHAGDLEGARELARKNIAAFNSDAPIITNAGGCGAMLTTYGHLFANDDELAEAAAKFSARVRDVSQQLGLPKCGPRQVLSNRACDLRHLVSSFIRPTRAVTHRKECCARSLAKVRPAQGTERCCGAAGIYNLLQPEMSHAC